MSCLSSRAAALRPAGSRAPSAARRVARPGLVAAAFAGMLACDFPISSSKYSVADGDVPDDLGGAPGVGGADPRVQTLVRAFAREDDRCATAFGDACAAALAACGESAGCLDYGLCMRERAEPTAETTCSDDGLTSIEDSWKFELVRHCWASRYAECDLGRNFTCVGVYGPPRGDRTGAAVRQQILVRGLESEQSDFTVSFCAEWTDCSTPVAEVAADPATGVYDATLPIGGKNFGAGNEWRGYRLVRGPEIPDSVVSANIPFWGRRLEITRLLSTVQTRALSVWYGMDAERSVFVQVVDCLSDPAPGIVFEVPTSASSSVGYVDEDGNSVDGATVATGAAGITRYDPAEPQTIEALRDGDVIATWSGELAAGMPRYLRLHPRGTH